MPKAARYGHTHGRVDKTGIGEANRKTRAASDAEEVFVEPAPHPTPRRPRRSSREVDSNNVQKAFVAAFAHLVDSKLFTPDEISAALHMSRATYYRHLHDLRELRAGRLEPSWDD